MSDALRPGRGTGRDPYRHAGEKFALCLAGTVVFTVGGEAHRLPPGDSIHFKSTIPHAYENPERRREARVLLVGSVPRGRIVA